MKKSALIAAVALALGVSATAQAAIFDPDGAGGANGPVNIGALDWGPTSILSQGANTAIGAFATGACSVVNTACQFNLFTHATLVGLIDANGNPLSNPTGLNSTFEITMIAMFREVVTGVSTLPNGNTIATFATVPTVPGFLQMFYDTTPDSVALTGRGYNDGRLILNGNTVGNSSSFFTVTSTTPVNLDQSGANDYTGQFTVTGTGSSTNIPVNSLTTDPTFFVSPLNTFGVQFANISIGLPFVSVDPSDCFTIAPQAPVIGLTTPLPTGCSSVHVNGTYLANTGELPPGYVPVTGSINGFSPIPPTGGPDFVAQTDFNSPLSSVPEPTSLALFGLGLGLAGFFGSLRRRLFS